MFDSRLRKLIDPPLDRLGGALARAGVGANSVTLAGFALGLLAVALIAFGLPLAALVPLLLGRLADGLDGAIARTAGRTDFGGFLDITCDFIVYGAVPLGFVLADPVANGAAGAVLLASFYANGSAFLAFAAVAERRGMESRAQGAKTLYYVGGLLEGGETIALFVLFCLFPSWFAPLAWGFGALCFVSAGARMLLAWRIFGA
ncbi:CDP-alcohol phosphatidyltransferase family protein [Pikeienuella piscinae]|uniref:CDP-alcohol phosphatidyltransferase family protein n=1 Tax=Pikeienuella piscinae TaxID=2748098 RepID=A0A7M3T6I2_9RHOB|nr:CDP-alcohol phosphatidyltransferase family protein [Pikeienuella piscinae]QIE57613.1 CDP-alcohol phosphatidyltransferase family protein [Pikeienuella piscinae]